MNESKLRKIVREEIKRIDEIAPMHPERAMKIASAMQGGISQEQVDIAIQTLGALAAAAGASKVWNSLIYPLLRKHIMKKTEKLAQQSQDKPV